MKIEYIKLGRYKYKLVRDFFYMLPCNPQRDIDHPYFRLDMTGLLKIKKGYRWDGPSGPAFDTKDFMRGSLVHDCLYQMFRLKLLDINYRDEADKLLYTMCLDDGMIPARAWYVYWSVRLFGESAATKEEKEPKVYTAP